MKKRHPTPVAARKRTDLALLPIQSCFISANEEDGVLWCIPAQLWSTLIELKRITCPSGEAV